MCGVLGLKNLKSDNCVPLTLIYSEPMVLNSTTFASDASRQLYVLRHDGNTLGVDGTQVGVLKEPH